MLSQKPDSAALRQRLHRASIRSAQLEGAKTSDEKHREKLTVDVAAAKGRDALSEEISRVFDALQQRALERSVGAFERLLSAILSDVLPGEGSVKLIPEFKANATWLDVALQKGGKLEDVVDANGGAVTNVVCAGLRYAALLRTKNRRLMILDEPDCWVKPERVPAFIKVIAEVAQQTKTQTFFITHHDVGLLEGHVNVVRFAKDEKTDKVFATPLAPLVAEWESEDVPGIRSIELINFRRHQHTVVPCFPGATAYIGDNNLGKSTALVSSFKALAYGESDDSMFRHDCDEAKIVFHLEKGRRLEWSRARKRNPTVLYRLFEKGQETPVMEGRSKSKNQAPDWVVDLLGVTRVDDLDIQVGNQKSPVFLLNDSAPRRAQILSVGKESGHLKTLMKRYEERKSSDRETVRQGEAQIARLDYRLARLAALPGLNERLAELFFESEDLIEQVEKAEQLTQHLAKLEAQAERVSKASKAFSILSKLPGSTPELVDTTILASTIMVLDKKQKVSALAVPRTLPVFPELMDVDGLLTVGKQLAALEKKVNALKNTPSQLPILPELFDLSSLHQVVELLTRAEGRVASAKATDQSTSKEMSELENEMELLKLDLGGECPLCSASLPETGLVHTLQHNHSHA